MISTRLTSRCLAIAATSFCWLAISSSANVFAADPQPKPAASAAPATPAAKGERMDVEAIRRKYWERGEDDSARVIQNRLYSKTLKFELGVFMGSVSSDPFLTVRAAGGSLGFHMSEAWGLNLVYLKHFVSDSSAAAALLETANARADTNKPASFKGGELAYSPIYGKLSLFGEMIVHYDLHVLGGYGITSTENGNAGTISFGVGQQFHLSKSFSLRFDYRAMRYSEDLYSRNAATAGNFVLSRTNWSDTLTFGITAFLGPL